MGSPIVFIREPAPPGSFYENDRSQFSWPNCLNPYDVDPAAPPPETRAPLPDEVGQVFWVDAIAYKVRDTVFDVGADISRYLAQYGPGVYTVVIWGDRRGESVALTNYSVFVESP
jgi:hypothetical protein